MCSCTWVKVQALTAAEGQASAFLLYFLSNSFPSEKATLLRMLESTASEMPLRHVDSALIIYFCRKPPKLYSISICYTAQTPTVPVLSQHWEYVSSFACILPFSGASTTNFWRHSALHGPQDAMLPSSL